MLPHLVCLLLYVTQTIHNTFQVSLTRNQSDAWMFHLLVYHFAIPLSYYKFCKVLIHILLFLNEGSAIFSWFWTPLPPPFFKGGSKFWFHPQEGGVIPKIKKGVEVWCRGQVFLKGGRLALFLFSFSKI